MRRRKERMNDYGSGRLKRNRERALWEDTGCVGVVRGQTLFSRLWLARSLIIMVNWCQITQERIGTRCLQVSVSNKAWEVISHLVRRGATCAALTDHRGITINLGRQCGQDTLFINPCPPWP